jgi:hypothetical protein
MHRKLPLALLGLLFVFGTASVLAADVNPAEAANPNDPSVSQVYDAARAGHLDQARLMMNQVLANHPHSARAHYVAAELDADMKNYGEAREELKTAEDITPGLPFANPQAVAALRQQIGASGGAPAANAARGPSGYVARPVQRSFPLGWVFVVGGIVLVVWLLMRRRTAAPYGSYPGTMPNPAMGPGTMVPPVGGFPSVMPGGGSGIVGGLASGLAVGAGIAAGEELVRHAFEPGRTGTPGPEPYVGNESAEPPPNADLGGPDFGISDGGGWDDGGSSGGDSGGGDWT